MIAGKVWDLPTMYCVVHLRASVEVANEVLYSHPDAARADAIKLVAKRLQDEAAVYAVDLHPGDIVVQEDAPDDWRTRYTVQWQPVTGRVILLGGQRDGEELAVPEAMIGQSLYFPVLVVNLWAGGVDDDVTPVPTDNLEYVHAGWHEGLRCWVYRYREN